MTSLAIETTLLCRWFAGRAAVHDVSLRVPEAMVYGFLGPNGAGKTTTIRMLLGLLKPGSGGVRLFGEPLAGPESLRRIGALVESPSLYPHLTGRENLEVTRRLIAAPAGAIARVLAIVRLEADADRRVREYSLGMKQRLGLAIALLSEPRLLILDEPVNGLDPAGIHEIRGLIRSLSREHRITVFLSSHLLSEIEQVADRVGIISAGRLLFEGSLAELHERQQPTLAVRATPLDGARKILEGEGYTVHGVEAGAMRLAMPSDVSAVCEALVRGGCRVTYVAAESASLEDLFLSMTATEGTPT